MGGVIDYLFIEVKLGPGMAISQSFIRVISYHLARTYLIIIYAKLQEKV